VLVPDGVSSVVVATATGEVPSAVTNNVTSLVADTKFKSVAYVLPDGQHYKWLAPPEPGPQPSAGG